MTVQFFFNFSLNMDLFYLLFVQNGGPNIPHWRYKKEYIIHVFQQHDTLTT